MKIAFLKVQNWSQIQKAQIKNLEYMLHSQKYNIKNTKQNHKNYKKYIYEIYFKNRVFFSR